MEHPTTAAHVAALLHSCIAARALRRAKSVHARIVASPALSSDTFLSNRLIELYSRCGLPHYAAHVFRSIPDPNVFSWNAIVAAASKSRDLGLAHHLFDQMPRRNAVSYNTMIGALARGGSPRDALNLYSAMLSEGLAPTHFTFASVLSALGSSMGLCEGRKCHGLVVKVGLDGNLFVENALLGMYAKCGSFEDAVKVFDEMAQPNEVSFTAMMGGLMQSGSVEKALRLFAKMHTSGIRVDPVAVSSVLGACTRVEDKESDILLGQSIHTMVIKSGFDSDAHVSNSLIDLYAKCGDMDKALVVFNVTPDVSVVSWNILIAGYGQRGDSKKAIEMLQLMQRLGFEPDEVTYISMLAACARTGDIAYAREMFDKIVSPNVTSWNAILSGYSQEDSLEEAISLFRKMQLSNVRPDRTTLALILSSCSGLGLLECGKQVHSASIRLALHVDMFVASGLVDMYSKCGHIEVAKRVFERMPERDVVSWNAMITGFSVHSLNKEAFCFFKQMRENGLLPTEFSYTSVINSCARLSSLPQGRQIHAQTAKDGYAGDVYVGSALIDMYAKCGNVEDARVLFDCMPLRNIVSWNEMIHGYAQNGCGKKAVELFEYMLTTEQKPDSVTFIAVLTACSHSGLVDEAIKYFDSMEKDYNIRPLADHYTCIIDSVGRAGRLTEAEGLIHKMPCQDDPIVWEVLLSACAVQGNAKLGKYAAENLLRLDPNNSSSYVLLSNIYASLGQWDDASAVRALMSNRGVVKDRGYSWINQKDGVRAFMVSDDLSMVDAERAVNKCHTNVHIRH
ncbi:pentatricopeptide repeat-containing protein At4g20770-like [Ananas comosus]|uniref:Pentatricopeptide repeat-containing protein At4g20770-like n=1 Tax=Ananas comosus TaxID=4615 RepID=A0A6P5GUQ1_ANACO|nr:pentatricopeptide repeat-containing protein At4g20770-like [Ananas comosus]